MSKEKYLILPGCDDSNRGDQALIWETVELARTAGYNGDYYMLANNENCIQSKKKKIGNVEPILIHPSEHFKNNKFYMYLLFHHMHVKNHRLLQRQPLLVEKLLFSSLRF